MDMPDMTAQAPMGGAAPQPPPVSSAQPVSAPPNPDYQKMMLAQALMGGGMGGGAPANSFAGGLAQGANPMIHAMMMQKMMGSGAPQAPQMPVTPSATMQQPATTPFMLGGAPTA